jgi:transposase
LLFGARDGSAQGRPLLDWATVHKEMRRKGVTLMLLWLEYKEANPDGYAYTQFTRLYKAWKRSLDVVMRQDHKAGERLFVDFPGETLPIYDPKTSELAMRAELFVAALGASGYVYAEAFPSQELMYWVSAHVHTFEAMGGCPRDRGVRQPALRGDPPSPLRARRERHLRRYGSALPGRDNAGSLVQATGQGQGRDKRLAGRALDIGTASQAAFHEPGPSQRGHRAAGRMGQRPIRT